MIYKKQLLKQVHDWVEAPNTQLEDLCKIVLQYFVDQKHLEEIIYDWIADTYGRSEAEDPCYDLCSLAKRIEEAVNERLFEATSAN